MTVIIKYSSPSAASTVLSNVSATNLNYKAQIYVLQQRNIRRYFNVKHIISIEEQTEGDAL